MPNFGYKSFDTAIEIFPLYIICKYEKWTNGTVKKYIFQTQLRQNEKYYPCRNICSIMK